MLLGRCCLLFSPVSSVFVKVRLLAIASYLVDIHESGKESK